MKGQSNGEKTQQSQIFHAIIHLYFIEIEIWWKEDPDLRVMSFKSNNTKYFIAKDEFESYISFKITWEII